MIASAALNARGQVHLRVDAPPQTFFPGPGRSLDVTLHNDTDKTVSLDLRMELIQMASDTGIPLGPPKTWKTVQLLPGQTVLDQAPVDFPPVKRETTFVIRWRTGPAEAVGRTEVKVYPTNLLHELKPLVGDTDIGVFDPQHTLKPLLKASAIRVEDFDEDGVEGFSGKLAIIGAFKTAGDFPETLAEDIRHLAKRGTAVVWIQTLGKKKEPLHPNFYAVSSWGADILIVQPELVANLDAVPSSQLNLIYFCQLALHPQISQLPILPRSEGPKRWRVLPALIR